MTRKLPMPPGPYPTECQCGLVFSYGATLFQPYCYACKCFAHTVYWLRRHEYIALGLTVTNYNKEERDDYAKLDR